MNPAKIDFLTIPIDALSMKDTLNLINKGIGENKNIQHVVINAAKVVAMQTDKELCKSVIQSDLINADGQSIVWAARFLGKPLPERVAGIDLMENLIELAHRRKYKCYFFGAKEEVVSRLVEIYKEKYSPDIIAGYRNGYYSEHQEQAIAEEIAKSGADMLFVAITSPKKELFLNNYKTVLSDVNFIMGVGGSFDVIAGITKRAPQWMQEMGLEWFFRFMQEPRRMWKRYFIGNFQFFILVLKEKFRKNK